MRLPLNEVEKYTSLPKDKEELISIISNKIGEVENVIDLTRKYENIVIAQIKDKKSHPNADKLCIYKIDINDSKDIQVLAGDKTLEIGDLVAYIKPGGIIPSTFNSEPFVIQSKEMRGEISNGMMCSERELDIGPNHTTVLQLPKDAPIGESFASYYNLDDFIIEIENKALTNRGDLFGLIGLARELSGSQNIKFESPEWYRNNNKILEPSEACLNFDVDNQAEALCPRYCAISMRDIKITDSPIWLKSFLLKSGIKPINVIVDITNYLMILTGQPLHAFDFDKVVKTDTEQADMGHIVIRTARSGERIHALDGNIYELGDRNLVIANSQYPIAIAGVIGGVDTEIDENTKNIILESANFDRYNLRKTSMELGIITEASTRFTRSQSPENCLPVIIKAVELLSELTQGEIASTVIDSYPNPQKKEIVTINCIKLRDKLGLQISNEEVIEILKNIEYQEIEIEDDFISVEVPKFRQDIEIEEDIYEDVVRLVGYEKIDPVLPFKKISATTKPAIIELKQNLRSILSNSGCNELLSYSFTNIDMLKLVNQDVDSCYKIKNPLSRDLEFMRPSILISLLEKGRLNIQQDIETFSIYDIGISHQRDVLDDENLPLEEWKLALLFSDTQNLIDGNPYYQVKKYLTKILRKFKVQNVQYTLLPDVNFEKLPKWIKVLSGSFESNSSAIVSAKVGESAVYIGIIGEISLKVKSQLSLGQFSAGLELNLESLLLLQNESFHYLSDSKYPSITQDICFIVPERMTFKELSNKVEETLSSDKLRSEVSCIDIYKKENSDSKNITLRISLSHTDRTLQDNDYQEFREKIGKNVKKLNISMIQ